MLFYFSGHTVQAVCESFNWCKDAGFKVVTHMMPDLPNVDMERDIEQFIVSSYFKGKCSFVIFIAEGQTLPEHSRGIRQSGSWRQLALNLCKILGQPGLACGNCSACKNLFKYLRLCQTQYCMQS